MTPIDRLRRIQAKAALGAAIDDPADLDWLAKGLGCYLDQAPAVRLDQALDLRPARGQQGWWTEEPRDQRDAVVGEMARQLFGQLDVPDAARGILALVKRNRERRGGLALNERDLLAQLARTGKGLPAIRQVQNIVEKTRKSDTPSNFPA